MRIDSSIHVADGDDDYEFSADKVIAAFTGGGGSGGDPAMGGDLSGPASSAQINAAAVGSNELAANAVTTVKINDGAVTTAKLSDNQITTAKLVNQSVTTGKISPGTNGQVLATSGGVAAWGNATLSPGSIVNADVSASAAISASKLAAGATGDTLKTINGIPAWTSPRRQNVMDKGAVADVVHGTNGSITATTQTFVGTGASFVNADVGKLIIIRGAGTSGGDLCTTITARGSSTQVTLNNAAGTTVSGVQYHYGTDDTAAFQAAVTALDSNLGGTIDVPADKYMLTAVSWADPPQGVQWIGEGSPGHSLIRALGSTQVFVHGANHGFTAGGGSGDEFRGSGFENLHIIGSSVGLSGVRFRRQQLHWMTAVACSDFTLGAGVLNDGTGDISQYGTFTDYRGCNDKYGFHSIHSNGLEFIGGYFDGSNDPVNPGPAAGSGTLGIWHESGDTMRLHGTRLQGYDTCFQADNGEGHCLIAPRFEIFNKGLVIGAGTSYFGLYGGSFNDNLNNVAGTIGIQVIAGAINATLFPQEMLVLATKISDSGTRTLYNTNTGTGPFMQHPGAIQAKQGFVNYTKTGAPVDGDFVSFVGSGLQAVDVTNSRLYVRVGSTWMYAQLV